MTFKKQRLILFILSLSLAVNASEIRYSVTPNLAILGEPLHLSLESNAPITTQISKDVFYPFELIEAKQSKTSYHAKLQIFKLGKIEIPTFNINTGSERIEIPAFPIEILSTNPENEIADILPGLKIEKPWRKWLLILSITIGLLAVLRFILKKPKKTDKFNTHRHANPKQDPSTIAIRLLQQLSKTSPNPEQYFLKISEIFRAYLHRTLNINALEMTSTELMLFLQKQTYNHEELKRFKHIFSTCDTIKFYKMQDIDMDFAINTVIPFIKHLKDRSK